MLLSDEQINSAQKVIELSLNASAKSLSYFTKTAVDVVIENKLKVINLSNIENLVEKEVSSYLISTELIGDLQGISYLHFTQNDVDKLMDSIYANKEFDEDKYVKKSEGLVKEIANIITAAAMSQFANHFRYTTYGDVPRLEIIKNESKSYVANYIERHNCFLDFRATLVSSEMNLNLDFVWFVDDSFVGGIDRLNN